MSDAPSTPELTPDLAVAYLGDLSTDIRAGAILDADGTLAAHDGFDEASGEQVQELVAGLFAAAEEAAGDGSSPDQFEVAVPEGLVYAVRHHGWTVAVVTGRYALSALMFYDLRMVARDLAGATAS